MVGSPDVFSNRKPDPDDDGLIGVEGNQDPGEVNSVVEEASVNPVTPDENG